jgi:hypothetical protein
MSLLPVGSSHTPLDAPWTASLQNFRLFQQPANVLNGCQYLDRADLVDSRITAGFRHVKTRHVI